LLVNDSVSFRVAALSDYLELETPHAILGHVGGVWGGVPIIPAVPNVQPWIQAGTTVAAGGGVYQLFFATPFPNALFQVAVWNGDMNANGATVGQAEGPTDRTQFAWACANTSAVRMNWLAIGY
jgi:hypothetical protein